MYKLEMHLHTLGRSPCALTDEHTIAQIYSGLHYDGIVCTNHFNRYLCDEHYPGGTEKDKVNFWLGGYKTLKTECAAYGIDVFLGMELLIDDLTYYKPTPPHAEMLLYGIEEQWLVAHPDDLFAMSLAELSALCRQKGWLMSQAHPFRDGINAQDPRLLEGGEIWNGHPQQNNHNDQAADFVLKNNLLPTAGSDFHFPGCEGSGVYLENAVTTDSQLVAELRRRKHKVFNKDGIIDFGKCK